MSWFKYATKALIHGSLDVSGRPQIKRQKLRGHLIILTYHAFSNKLSGGLFSSLPVRQFERQLCFLRDHFEVVSLETGLSHIGSGFVGEKPFLALTIDDGFENNYTHAWPVLKRYEMPATIFLATDYIDTGRPPWPTQIIEILERAEKREMSFPFHAKLETLQQRNFAAHSLKVLFANLAPTERFAQLDSLRSHLGVPADTKYPALTWDQVREMHKNGMCFGSHSVFHGYLPSLSSDAAKQELCDSKQRLEEELGEPCNLFAYPDGAFDERTSELVKSAGFVAAFTQVKGSNVAVTNPFKFHRIEVPAHDPLQTFMCRTSLIL